MAVITAVLPGNQVWGESNTQTVTIAPTTSDYATGGYVLTPGSNGITLTTIYGAMLFAGGAGYQTQFNKSTNAIQVYDPSSSTENPTELANGTNLSGVTFTFQLVGV